jgi:hypothetical protein
MGNVAADAQPSTAVNPAKIRRAIVQPADLEHGNQCMADSANASRITDTVGARRFSVLPCRESKIGRTEVEDGFFAAVEHVLGAYSWTELDKIYKSANAAGRTPGQLTCTNRPRQLPGVGAAREPR